MASAEKDEMEDKMECAEPKPDPITLLPAYAVICSFFNRFGVMLGMPRSFVQLYDVMARQSGSDEEIDRDVVDLHVKLMKLCGLKSTSPARWLPALSKYCSYDEHLADELLQLERFGYAHSSVETKLNILKSLCEKQFDVNVKLKESLNSCLSPAELRLRPIGHDVQGLAYWYQQDGELNIRLYSEERDDQAGGTWLLRGDCRGQLYNIVHILKGGKSLKDMDVIPSIAPEREEEVKEGEGKGSGESTNTSNKTGTYLDMFMADEPVPKPKRGQAKPPVVEVKPAPRKAKSRSKESSSEEEEEEEDDHEELKEKDAEREPAPAELEEIADRRVQPRRSTRSGIVHAPTPITKSPPKKTKVVPIVVQTASSSQSSDDDEEEDEFVPLAVLKKRLSSSKRGLKPEVEDESESEEGEEEEKKERKTANEESLCRQCNKSDHWEVLLLCDLCDAAWHTWCLQPQLWFVPDDDWFCPDCQHAQLTTKLTAVLADVDVLLVRKEAEDKKKVAQADRMKREMEYIGISLNNIIAASTPKSEEDDESEEDVEEEDHRGGRRRGHHRPKVNTLPIALARSRRTRTTKVDYNFSEYDELIEEACDEIGENAPAVKCDDLGRPTGGLGRGKDMANILKHTNTGRTPTDAGGNGAKRKTKEYSDDDSEEEEEEDTPTKPLVDAPPVAKVAKSKRKLTDVDEEHSETDVSEYVDSDASAAMGTPAEPSSSSNSDSEYLSDSEKVATRRSSRIRRADREFVVSGSDSDEDYTEGRRRGGRKAKAPPPKKKKRRRGESSESDEESDDSLAREMGRSNKSTRYRANSDSSDYTGRRKKRTAVKNRKTIVRDSSDEEEEKGDDVEFDPAEEGSDNSNDGAKEAATTTIPNLTRKRSKVVDSDDEDEEEEADSKVNVPKENEDVGEPKENEDVGEPKENEDVDEPKENGVDDEVDEPMDETKDDSCAANGEEEEQLTEMKTMSTEEEQYVDSFAPLDAVDSPVHREGTSVAVIDDITHL